jgi:hypothetical protein
MTAELVRRFWDHVDKTGHCWRWTGRIGRGFGYGYLHVGRRMLRAHRVSWELAHGPIADGLVVCHHCDTPACVRPAHLFVATPAANMADMVRKKRSFRPTGESNGKHRLTRDAARAIRQRYWQERWTQRALAAAFAISQQHVSRICRRRARREG